MALLTSGVFLPGQVVQVDSDTGQGFPSSYYALLLPNVLQDDVQLRCVFLARSVTPFTNGDEEAVIASFRVYNRATTWTAGQLFPNDLSSLALYFVQNVVPSGQTTDWELHVF